MISDCDNVQIINSSANKNGFDGIYVKNSSAVQISGSILQNNAIAGLAVLSDGVTVVNSNISTNKAGGILLYGNQSSLIGNRVYSNSGRGLILDGSAHTRIWNNVFNNTKNVEVTKTSHSTIWNISPQEGVAITGSPYLGGNFWGNPTRSGVSDTCIPNSQGYCPTTYNPGGTDSDYYPLARYENNAPLSNNSVSSFSSGKISGDLNQNNRVEFDDVVTLMELITENQTLDLTWDLNSDNRINLQDVIVLFERLNTDS
jgi:parallel beta-helix repeat protein